MEYLTIIRFSILLMFIVFTIVLFAAYITYRVKRGKHPVLTPLPLKIDGSVQYRNEAKADTVQQVVFPSTERITVAPATEYKPAHSHSKSSNVHSTVKFQVVNPVPAFGSERKFK